MATSEQLSQIREVVVGLFNAAPGKSIMAELVAIVDSGASVEELAQLLSANPLFVDGIMGNATTTEAQVAVLMNHFGVAADSDPASPGSQAEAHFTARVEAGVGFGDIVYEAVVFLNQADLPAEFSETATLLKNKSLVSEAYSEIFSPSNANLSELQSQLEGLSGSAALTKDEATAIVLSKNGESISGDVTAVDGTAETFVFAADTTGDSKISGFTTSEDSIIFDLNPAAAGITTLDKLNEFELANGNEVAVQQNQITGSTFVNLGLDEATGNVITLELVGVADPSTVEITVV